MSRRYYFNTVTGESTYDFPEAAPAGDADLVAESIEEIDSPSFDGGAAEAAAGDAAVGLDTSARGALPPDWVEAFSSSTDEMCGTAFVVCFHCLRVVAKAPHLPCASHCFRG